MDITELVSTDIIPDLKLMGRQKWLLAHPDPDYNNRTIFQLAKVTYQCDEVAARRIKIIRETLKAGSASGVAAAYALSRCIAAGPKCFCPSLEQAEAMLHVEARIDAKDYQQAYPQLIVRFPAEFRRIIAEKHKQNPQYLPLSLLLHHEDDLFVFMCRFPGPHGHERSCSFALRPGTIIEDLLRPREDDDTWEARVSHDMMRVAVNLSYLLIHIGHREDDSERRRVAKKRPDLLSRTAIEVFLAQEIVVRKIAPHQSSGDGSHISPHPHWRRGHWANVACGTGHSERKLIFRRPTFVMGEVFTGDLADTQVTLKGQ